jgi:hypothetical protein
MARQKDGSVAYWLSVLQGKQLGWAKQAELGGDGQDIPFEQAFSNLAHAYLRDKAPSLLDYEVGFQLLERNQDNTKSVGVMAFKVGPQWIYAPVFFLRGELKGHELLYLKDQDMFVPMKENWLNYILNRKPNILGDGVNRNTKDLGLLAPDLQQLKVSPEKRAEYPDWAKAVLPVFAYMATTHPLKQKKFDGMTDFPTMVKQAGPVAVSHIWKIANHYPDAFKSLTEIHGDAISDAISYVMHKRADSILDKPAIPTTRQIAKPQGSVIRDTHTDPIKSGALQIITFDYTSFSAPAEGPDEEDGERLLRDGILIKDEREGDEVSVAYNTQVEKKLTNPSESGLHEILTNVGDVDRCFIAVHPRSGNSRANFATVVRLDGDDKSWLNIHPSHVWSVSRLEGDGGGKVEPYRDWFDGLSDADSLSKGGTYMVVGPGGEASVPFRVRKSLGTSEGTASYDVKYEDYAELSRPSFVTESRNYMRYDSGNYDKWRDGERVHLNAKDGSALRSSRGDLYVPKGYKLLVLRKPSKSDSDLPDLSERGSSEPSPIRPGNFVDAELAIMKKTAELSVWSDGLEVEINRKRMQPKQAFIALVQNHGLREQQARTILKQADRKGKVRYRVKYAEWIKQAQDPMLGFGPGAPSIPEPPMGSASILGGSVPAQYEQQQELKVPGMEMGNPQDYNPADVPDPMAMQAVQSAAQTGQKEIFDTAIIGSMLKAVRQDTMVDRYLSDLMKGMDRVGRILFMFYWHQDDFADRYGKMDMPELEDSLRNTFESVGDLVLFLKQKSIDPYPEEGNISVDLDSISGA